MASLPPRPPRSYRGVHSSTPGRPQAKRARAEAFKTHWRRLPPQSQPPPPVPSFRDFRGARSRRCPHRRSARLRPPSGEPPFAPPGRGPGVATFTALASEAELLAPPLAGSRVVALARTQDGGVSSETNTSSNAAQHRGVAKGILSSRRHHIAIAHRRPGGRPFLNFKDDALQYQDSRDSSTKSYKFIPKLQYIQHFAHTLLYSTVGWRRRARETRTMSMTRTLHSLCMRSVSTHHGTAVCTHRAAWCAMSVDGHRPRGDFAPRSTHQGAKSNACERSVTCNGAW